MTIFPIAHQKRTEEIESKDMIIPLLSRTQGPNVSDVSKSKPQTISKPYRQYYCNTMFRKTNSHITIARCSRFPLPKHLQPIIRCSAF